MSPMLQKTLWAVLIGIGLALGLYIGGQQQDSSLPEAPAAGSLVEQTNIKDLDGKLRNLGEWSGKLMVVNFWATWCPPCRREIPGFVDLQNQYGDQGLQFIGIAIDDAAKVRSFADEYPINYPLLVGQDDATRAGIAFGNDLGALPYTVVIDQDQRIIYRRAGELPKSTLEDVIKPYL